MFNALLCKLVVQRLRLGSGHELFQHTGVVHDLIESRRLGGLHIVQSRVEFSLFKVPSQTFGGYAQLCAYNVQELVKLLRSSVEVCHKIIPPKNCIQLFLSLTAYVIITVKRTCYII